MTLDLDVGTAPTLSLVEWHHMPQLRPGLATSSDGRVKIWDEKACLILPAPAAEILQRIEARKACSRGADC